VFELARNFSGPSKPFFGFQWAKINLLSLAKWRRFVL